VCQDSRRGGEGISHRPWDLHGSLDGAGGGTALHQPQPAVFFVLWSFPQRCASSARREGVLQNTDDNPFFVKTCLNSFTPLSHSLLLPTEEIFFYLEDILSTHAYSSSKAKQNPLGPVRRVHRPDCSRASLRVALRGDRRRVGHPLQQVGPMKRGMGGGRGLGWAFPEAKGGGLGRPFFFSLWTSIGHD